jgi:hypothetical protein
MFIIIYLFNTKRVKKNHYLLILNAGPFKNKLKHAEALRRSYALCVKERNWFIAEIEAIANFKEKKFCCLKELNLYTVVKEATEFCI